MVRISDILKKMRQYQGRPQEEGPKAAPTAEPSKPDKEKPKPEEMQKEQGPKELPTKDHITFIEAMKKGKESKEAPAEAHIHEIVKKAMPEKGEGQNIYKETVEYCKIIATGYAKLSQEIEKDVVAKVAARIADYIFFGGQELLNLVHEPYPDKENYRIYDLVNTGILGGHIGASLGYNKLKLVEVIIVGLFHDVGMLKDLDFINEPRRLEPEEISSMRHHPEKGASYIEALAQFSDEVIKGILHHHERISGKGYPQGLSDDDINEYAQIVAVADVYEAMIHYRPHKAKTPSAIDVIKELISFKEVLFSPRIIKALIGLIGIYPVGSWVEINTGEICRVLTTNEGLPLRPILGVVFDKERKKLKEIQTVDLKSTASLYIKRPIEESELKQQ